MEVERRGVGGQFQQKLFVVQYTIDCEKEKFSHLEDWQQFPKNENFTKIDQNAKNTKNVRITSYSPHGMSKKLAAQKYRVSIFRTNEGDFSGTPQKKPIIDKSLL